MRTYLSRTIQKITLTLLGAAAFCLFAAGCASNMSKSECETGDFYKIGLRDGQNGKSADHFTQLANECQKEGVTLQSDKYNYGRKVGLTDFCSDNRARRDAKNNKTDSICLSEKVPPYETAYTQELNELRKNRTASLSEIESTESSLQKKQRDDQERLKQIDQQQKAVPTN